MWRRFGAKFGDVVILISYLWCMPNQVPHPPSDVCVEHLLSSVLGKEQAARLSALMEQIGPEEEEIIMGLIQEIIQSREQIQEGNAIIAYLRRRLFGQKRERYIDPNQGDLFPDSLAPELPPVKPAPAGKPKERRRRKPRVLFSPEQIKDLPIEVIEIDPAGDLSSLKKIGTEDHYVLDYRPARLRVLHYVRNRYVDPKDAGAGVLTGELPADVKGKRTVTADLLSHVVVNKYVDHVPVTRTQKQLSRLGVHLPKSTLTDWVSHVANDLRCLYERQRDAVLESGYIQADETRIPVRDSRKSKESGKHHLGYFWAYSAPRSRLIFFEYQQGRSLAGPSAVLANYQGKLQTDAYCVYDRLGAREGVEHFNCVAHCRRKFEAAKSSAPGPSARVLSLFRQVYAMERELREGGASFAERRQKRQEKSGPIFEKIKTILQTPPMVSSQAWKEAVYYALVRWDKLTRFLKHGDVEIDSNLIENRIRPIALGRKNYLFAGSHAAAQRAAILYSLLNTCLLHEVNPTQWLTDVLKRIPKTANEDLHLLLPHHWKSPREPTLAKAA